MSPEPGDWATAHYKSSNAQRKSQFSTSRMNRLSPTRQLNGRVLEGRSASISPIPRNNRLLKKNRRPAISEPCFLNRRCEKQQLRCPGRSVQSSGALHDLGRVCAPLCHQAGDELDQIQFLPGRAPIEPAERYLGCEQRFRNAVNDHIGPEPDG